jgi:hypothetical protein
LIKLENTQVTGWEAAIRGMRNPKNSWDRSDSTFFGEGYGGVHGTCDNIDISPSGLLQVGNNDFDLMGKLAKGGPVHAKYRRMIVVYVDITAPLYWWKEFDTYKVGTVANSCSTMHKIADKPFERSDFSWEHIDDVEWPEVTSLGYTDSPEINNYTYTELTIELLNYWRDKYNSATDEQHKKSCWWQMIQLLPSSYNQKRTVMLNYEVLAGIWEYRKNHKLDEWKEFCKWVETLPYSELITGKVDAEEDSSKISMHYNKDGDYIVITISKKMAINLNAVIKGEESGLYYEDDFIGMCKELRDNGDKVDLYFKLMPLTDGPRIVDEYNAQKLRFICIMGAKDRFIYKHLDENRRGVFEEVHNK